MEITMYARTNEYNEIELLTENEFFDMVREEFDQSFNDDELVEEFNEYLDDYYCAADIYFSTEEEKESIMADFKNQHIENYATNHLWEKFVKEITP